METSVLIISVLAMGGIGLSFSILLVAADKKLRVEDDPRVTKIMSVLPMTNCGACGSPGCSGFADDLIEGKAKIVDCVPGGQEVVDLLANIMGVDSQEALAIKAVLLCQGGIKETKRSAVYRGDQSCLSADLTGGEKDCAYACLGYGDCVDSCEFDAMVMNDNGLPVIFYDKCVGCTDCAKICPRDLIEMHPVEHELFVYCKNLDKGGPAKKSCEVACIGCNLCVKDCSVEEAIIIDDNLAIINYETCPQNDESIHKCPTNCIKYGEEKKMTKEYYYEGLANASVNEEEAEGVDKAV